MLFSILRFATWSWMKIQKIYRDCCKQQKGYVLVTETPEDIPLIIHNVIRTRENGQRDDKYFMNWVNQENTTTFEELFQHVMPPWLLITKDGEDYTERLHPYVAKGNFIQTQFLNWRFGEGEWKILNTKTFEEELFPSEGIIIK